MAEIDIADITRQSLESLYECADFVCKHLDDDKEEQLRNLESIVEEYSVIDIQQTVAEDALSKVKEETDIANIDTLQQRFNNYLETMTQSANTYKNHNFVSEFKKHVAKAKSITVHTPVVDEDIALTQYNDQLIDPITKKPIENAMKNKKCGHTYERDSIFRLLEKRKAFKCPVVGCSNKAPMSKEDLICDEEYNFRRTLTTHSTMIQDPASMTDPLEL